MRKRVNKDYNNSIKQRSYPLKNKYPKLEAHENGGDLERFYSSIPIHTSFIQRSTNSLEATLLNLFKIHSPQIFGSSDYVSFTLVWT